MDQVISTEIDEILDSEAGSDATLTTAGPVVSSIRVIFYNQYQAASMLVVDWESARPMADCKTSDVSAAAQDDTLLIEGTTYKIDEIQPQDSGWTRLILYKENT